MSEEGEETSEQKLQDDATAHPQDLGQGTEFAHGNQRSPLHPPNPMFPEAVISAPRGRKRKLDLGGPGEGPYMRGCPTRRTRDKAIQELCGLIW